MRRLASLLSRPSRLAVPAVALLVLAGTATAAAAAVPAGSPPSAAHSAAVAPAAAAKAPAPFLWHTLPLANGWASASKKSLVTGTPAWAIGNGVVYLRGAIKQTVHSGSDIVAQLPQIAWPTHNLYLQVYTSSAVPGVLYIGADGSVEAYYGNSATFTSLAAVSYTTKTVKSGNVALKNGWLSSQSSYDTGNPAYSVSNGVVYLSGSMHTGGTSRLAFVLPKAARPAAGMYISTYTFDGSTGWLHIQSTGQVYAEGTGATAYTNLANVSFPVASTKWHRFTLTAGWKSGAGQFHTAAPAYTVINGVVYLTGSMHQPVSGTGLWTFIPAPARTTGDVVEIEADTSKGSTGSVAMTNSLGLVGSEPFSNARAFTSLAGIAYPPSS
jgi:hypothetical protein